MIRRTILAALGPLLLAACGAGEEDPGPGDGDPGGRSVAVLAGTWTVGSADGVGTAARFHGPMGLAVAPGGKILYVADTGNHTLRQVDLTTGMTRTLAGAPGQAGTRDGTGPEARFEEPRGLALARDGRGLYLLDGLNYAVRQVDLTTLAVRTLAGDPRMKGSADGTGAAARFGLTGGAALDGSGTALYIADRGNHTIRKLDLTSGAVTTLAGTAGMRGHGDGRGNSARFNGPSGLALDPEGGRLFVTDSSNHVVRAIDLTTLQVTTLAGAPGRSGSNDGAGAAARFSHPHGLALAGGQLFVSGLDGAVRRVAIDSGAVTTLAGRSGQEGSRDGAGAEARFLDSYAVAADGDRVYVADRGNSNVRLVTGGEVRTLVGAPEPTGARDGRGEAARFAGPAAVVLDKHETAAYIADTENHLLRRIALPGGEVTTLAGQPGMAGAMDGPGAMALLDRPIGLAIGPGRLYVSEEAAHTLRAVDLDPVRVTTLAGAAGEPGYADGPGGAARFDGPAGLALHAAGGVLYVAEEGNHIIRRVRLGSGAAEVTTVAGGTGAAGFRDGAALEARFRGPAAVAIDSGGTVLYVADRGNRVVRQIDLMSGMVTTLAGTPGEPGAADGVGAAARFRSPGAIALTPDGQALLVADSGNHAIRRVALATREVTTLVGKLGQGGGLTAPQEPLSRALLYQPTGLAVGPTLLLFTAESAIYMVR
jgi:DNA-binding beta-propeller fold protein YncE